MNGKIRVNSLFGIKLKDSKGYMIKRLIILLLLIIFTPVCAEAIQAKNGYEVRVGISDTDFARYYFQDVEVSSTDDFVLIDKSNNNVICEFLANTPATVSMKENLFDIYMNGKEVASGLKGPIVASSDTGFLYIPNLKRAGKTAIYRGTFELTKSDSKDNLFSVVNVLDIQSYLRGVVPNEMPVKFGLEALKAQTVTARNYVLKPREKNYHNFDVCDSVACQVYYGAGSESELSDRAIAETENIVAMSNGELILALYSSTAGGYTEDYENAFFDAAPKGFPPPIKTYLRGVPDNDKIKPLKTEGDVREFYLSTPTTFDNKSPYFRWDRAWEVKELEDVLKGTLKTNSSTGFVKPALNCESDFGKLRDIKVIRRGVSGKAVAVEIQTDKNNFVVEKELVIRRVFQKDSKPLPSANIVFDFSQDTKGNLDKIVVHGGGFGHGVGMSQWGAGMMSAMGYSYDQILKHYYSGISIATYPVILTNEPGKDTDSVYFYTKEKKGVLFVENKFRFSELIVVVNSRELRYELAPHLFKPTQIDLSPYMKKGRNEVTFILPYNDNQKKSLRLYIELGKTGETEHD